MGHHQYTYDYVDSLAIFFEYAYYDNVYAYI